MHEIFFQHFTSGFFFFPAKFYIEYHWPIFKLDEDRWVRKKKKTKKNEQIPF